MMESNKPKHSWAIYHVLFWIAIAATFFLSTIRTLECDFKGYLLDNFSAMAVVAAIVYSNYFYLLKIYQKNKIAYFIAAAAAIVAFAWLYGIKTFAVCDNFPVAPRDNSWFGILTRSVTGFRYLIISSLLWFVQQSFEKEKRINEIRIEKISAELNYLRSQVNPHFLFNTLNNLYGLALQKSDKTPDVIMRLSGIMDYMLYNSDGFKVPLKKEIENIENYIELEKIRQGNNAVIEFSASGVTTELQIVPMLLLPLVENAFTHGVNTTTGGGFLKTGITVASKSLSATIINNKGITGNVEKKSHATGIQNLRKRLELFYPGRYSLEISETENQYKATLKIELDEV